MKLTIVIYAILLCLPSCDPFALKPLDIHTVKKNSIVARWFVTSSITSIHNHVEILSRSGWEQVMESDEEKIYDVLINRDTVIIQARQCINLYQLQSYFWGTYVRIDTSISDYQYHQKFP